MLERIKLIIKTKNLSASQFADKVGVQRSSVSHVLSGRNKPSLEFIQKVLMKFPDIRTEWLLFGKGSMSNAADLFSSLDKDSSNNNRTEIASQRDETNNENEVESKKIKESNVSNKIVETDKYIVKIVMFYNDNTFTDYSPKSNQKKPNSHK